MFNVGLDDLKKVKLKEGVQTLYKQKIKFLEKLKTM